MNYLAYFPTFFERLKTKKASLSKKQIKRPI